MNGVYKEVIKGIQIMKNIFIVIALFLFASMSTAIYAGSQSDGSNKGDVTDGKAKTGNIHEMCWQGSNSGNQHDSNADEFSVTFESGATDNCAPKDNGNGRAPKHCTHTNKNGNKHKDSASGC